jgi:hypothetical protein
MRRGAAWGPLVGLIALAGPVPARAADDTASREAQARFVEGIGRVKAGDFEAARISFAQAYTVLHKPDILWNLALAEHKSGHLVDALAHFKQLAHDGANQADRAKAGKHVDELMAQTGHIEVVAPPGAQVAVDGAAVGVAPLAEAVDVAPGKHQVALHPPQGAAREAEADAFAGQTAHVSFLVADPPAGPPVAATEAQGAAPEPPAPPADRAPAATSQGISMARIATVATLTGAAAASAVIGIYFGVTSQSNSEDAKAYQVTNSSSACAHITSQNAAVCNDWNSAVNAQNRDAALSDGFYVGAGLLAVGAVATWFLWPRDATRASAVLMPAVGPGGLGVTAVGSF